MEISQHINALLKYGRDTGLLRGKTDEYYAANRLLDCLGLDAYEPDAPVPEGVGGLEAILKPLLDFALSQGLIEEDTVTYRDLFDTRLMDCLMPRPSEVEARFWSLYMQSPEEATAYFYRLSQDSNYIRRERIARDIQWKTETEYGALDITINLSKPEKDPRDIAAAKLAKQSGYPKCLLCMENIGYAGRVNHPARQNHRVIPLTMNGTDWGFQYSPYVYYNEHCIVFNASHTPMKIEKASFVKLFDFVRQFPHYFLGSNADLPIVGGSILSHDHFQGGNYSFAMARAGMEKCFRHPDFPEVEAGVVRWPMSVVRLRGEDTDSLTALAELVLNAWRGYTDEAAVIYAQTDGEPHNTITPIARCAADGRYELDLVLRNNLCTKEHPMGLYHPHAKLHHIKKENIGLIEVMGLAVLPARLRAELEALGRALLAGADIRTDEQLSKHADWVDEWWPDYSGERSEAAVAALIRDETGQVFKEVLEDAGVYKCTQEGRKAFEKFLTYAGFGV